MKQATQLLILCTLVLILGRAIAGPDLALELAFGTLAALAAMISATFLWLWRERATPLALGMSFSWAGTALILGQLWWIEVNMPGLIPQMPLSFLAFLMTGCILHLAAIDASFGRGGRRVLLPVAVALLPTLLLIF